MSSNLDYKLTLVLPQHVEVPIIPLVFPELSELLLVDLSASSDMCGDDVLSFRGLFKEAFNPLELLFSLWSNLSFDLVLVVCQSIECKEGELICYVYLVISAISEGFLNQRCKSPVGWVVFEPKLEHEVIVCSFVSFKWSIVMNRGIVVSKGKEHRNIRHVLSEQSLYPLMRQLELGMKLIGFGC